MFRIRMRELRENAGYKSQQAFATAFGTKQSTIANWESGVRTPRYPTLQRLADFFGVSVDYLLGREEITPSQEKNLTIPNILPLPEAKKIPLLGEIACGDPILATENISEWLQIDANIRANFALRCKGDSMINARIFDGDIVYIHQQPIVENGEIAAVIVSDINTEATLKRVYVYDDHVVLEAENPMYKPLVFWGADIQKVKILGKAVAFTSFINHK